MNVSITSPTASEPEPSAEPTAYEIIANAAALAAAKAGQFINPVFSLGAHNPRGAKSMSSPRANGAAGNNPRRRSNRNASIRNANIQKAIESATMSVLPPPPHPPPPQSEASATDYQTPAQTISSSSGSSEEIDYSGQKAHVNSL